MTVNPPCIDSLKPPAWPMEGYPLLPSVSLSFASEAASRWRWLRRGPGSAGGAEEWQPLGCNSISYTPGPADVGCMLRVECTPGASASSGADGSATTVYGEPASVEFGPVRPAPVLPTAARVRALGGAAPTPRGALRVVTYNILVRASGGRGAG